MLQQPKRWQQLPSTSGGRVALQVESRAVASSAWTVSLTAQACFNHWRAHEEVYSNGMANQNRVTGAQYASFGLSNAAYSST